MRESTHTTYCTEFQSHLHRRLRWPIPNSPFGRIMAPSYYYDAPWCPAFAVEPVWYLADAVSSRHIQSIIREGGEKCEAVWERRNVGIPRFFPPMKKVSQAQTLGFFFSPLALYSRGRPLFQNNPIPYFETPFSGCVVCSRCPVLNSLRLPASFRSCSRTRYKNKLLRC